MDLLTALHTHRLVAIVRGDDPRAALRSVLALVEEGVSLVEVSLSGAGALDVIADARTALGPDAPLGAGTVLTAADARAALNRILDEYRTLHTTLHTTHHTPHHTPKHQTPNAKRPTNPKPVPDPSPNPNPKAVPNPIEARMESSLGSVR